MATDDIIVSGRLKKTNQPFIIRNLTREDIFALHELHKLILSNLKKGQECFIHHKSIGDFVKMLENPEQLLIGAFVEDKLIGYSSANFITEKNINGVLPDFNLDYAPDKIVVLEQASVNPQYRGNNLASIMNAARQKVACQQYGKKYAVTMVDINNFYSYRNGFRNGMCITQATVDPDDGGHVVYLAKEFGKNPKFKKRAGTQELHYTEMKLDNVAGLLAQGYVAYNYNDENQTVLFSKTFDFKYRQKDATHNNRFLDFSFLKLAGARE